jgi:hypothetical protein
LLYKIRQRAAILARYATVPARDSSCTASRSLAALNAPSVGGIQTDAPDQYRLPNPGSVVNNNNTKPRTLAKVRARRPVERRVSPDLEAFERDGFLVFENLAGPRTVRALREVYDGLLNHEIECTGADNKLGRIIRQIMNPSSYHALFRDNEAFNRGREIAAVLLGVDKPEPFFDMLIYKEPGQLAETPWHQDFAYYTMPFTAPGVTIPYRDVVQFWTALDDADPGNGCMHFVPGVHHFPLLEHYVAAGDPDYSQRLLAIRDPEEVLDLATAVPCPLKAGGATVHSYGTPHFTPGNRTSDRPRRAYIFSFANPRHLESLRSRGV